MRDILYEGTETKHMPTFLTVWFGQVVSLLGSKLTEFALGVWVIEKTDSATQFGFAVMLFYLPNVLVSPIAGALVDRWNRRWAMILSDSVAGISTLIMIGLVFSGRLEIWHIYLGIAISSICGAFQLPAYTAAIAQLVPRKRLDRANGMVQISKGAARLVAPALAGLLMTAMPLERILLIDVSTFLVALVTLLSVRFPPVKRTVRSSSAKVGQLLREMVFSWNYIAQRPGLVRLSAFIAVSYFTIGALDILMWLFILEFASQAELGLFLSIGGCGMLLGSLAISMWGGPKRRINAILSLVLFQGVLVLLGGLRGSVLLAGVAVFGYLFALPIITSCNQTIWQNKIPIKLQGRIFALQGMLERSLAIVACIITGPLIDNVFEPLMTVDGLLADSVGRIIGVGPGRGICLLLVLMGLINIVATMIAWSEPRIRRVEMEIPDAIPSRLGMTQMRL